MELFAESCSQLRHQHGVLTWVPIWRIAFISVYAQHSVPCSFLPPQKWYTSAVESSGWASQSVFKSPSIRGIMYRRSWGRFPTGKPTQTKKQTPKGAGLGPLSVVSAFIFIRQRLLKLESWSINSLYCLQSLRMENENINSEVSLGKETKKRVVLLPFHRWEGESNS